MQVSLKAPGLPEATTLNKPITGGTALSTVFGTIKKLNYTFNPHQSARMPTMKKLLFLLFVSFNLTTLASNKPDLLLAQSYNENIDVSQYWVSEKLDGVRAFWDGKQLISRGGHKIHAPSEFTQHFPSEALDGELWVGRRQFAQTLSTVSKDQPIKSEWQAVAFYVFELPDANGNFSQRLQQLETIISQSPSPYLKLVPQFRVANTQALMQKLKTIEAKGGEGLMLHHQDAAYETGRSQALLKLKSYQDAEASVIGYRPGKGKYHGMVGALIVKNAKGQVFALGSGLTDALRKNPPAIGTVVTYRYNGLTNNGLPRFARFIRVHINF